MNDSNKSSNGLLVLKLSFQPSREQAEALAEQIGPLAEKLGVEPLVLPEGLDVELKMGSEALLLRVCEALEKIAAQGEAPEVNFAENAPQALNARPSSLNSRPAYTHREDEPCIPPKDGTFILEKGEQVVVRDPNYQPRTEPYGSTGSGGLLVKPRG